MNIDELLKAAETARQRAYAPYSKFQVGAALLTTEGDLFLGCNVENISYGLTLCAERNAVASAIAAGKTSFAKILILADTDVPVSPCGACRQFLAEFAPALPVYLATVSGRMEEFCLKDLLPRAKTGILNAA